MPTDKCFEFVVDFIPNEFAIRMNYKQFFLRLEMRVLECNKADGIFRVKNIHDSLMKWMLSL